MLDHLSEDAKKIIAIFGAFALVSTGAIASRNLFESSSLSQDTEAKYIAVEFVVLDTKNEPLEGVNVQFISQGSPEPRRTNTDGFVGIDIPERDKIQVILTKTNCKTIDRTLNLKTDPQRTVTYQMECDTK